MEPFSIRQTQLLGSSRCVTVRDGIVTMAKKRLGFSEVVETPIEQIHPKATHLKHSAPKVLLFGIGLLASAIALVVIALRIDDFNVGGLLVLLAVVFGVLGEQMLEMYFGTKKNELIYINVMTGTVAVALRQDKPNKPAFDEFLQRFSSCLPDMNITGATLSEDKSLTALRVSKQMLDEGLITRDDYARRKEQVLGMGEKDSFKLH